MAPWIFIFSIVLGAEYLSYVKFIAIYALTLFGYIISVLASVLSIIQKNKGLQKIEMVSFVIHLVMNLSHILFFF